MKAKRVFGVLFAGFLALAAAFAVCAVFANRTGGVEPVFAGEKQYARAAVFEGGSLLAARDNTLAAYSPEGELLWEDAALTNIVVAAAIAPDGGTAYAASGNRVIRYRMADGVRTDEISSYAGDAGKTALSNITDIAVDFEGNRIAISHGSAKSRHFLTLIETDTKRTVFSVAVGVTSDCVIFSGNSLYLGMDSGNVRQYDPDGTLKAAIRLDDDVADLCAEEGRIYAVTAGGTVALLDFSEGKAVATYDLKAGNALASPVRIAAGEGGVFVAGSDGVIDTFDLSLSRRNQFRCGGAVWDVVLYGGRLYCPVSGVGLCALDADSALASAAFGVVSIVLAAAFVAAAVVFAVLRFSGIKRLVFSFGRAVWNHKTAYGMLIPVFGLLAVFGFYPMLIAIVRAFTDWNSSTPAIHFNGLANFVMMVSEGYFLTGIRNLAIFLLSYVVKILTVPLLTALMVYSLKSARAKYLYRYLFVLPMVVPSVVSALMWKNIYDPNFGLLNEILASVGLGQYQTEWLSNPNTAIPSLIFVGFPFVDSFSFLIYYSAMVNIPSTTLEAAELDGVTASGKFFSIILPMISPQIKILLMLGFINQIQDFNLILLLTKGGPGTETYVPGYELYLNATSFGRYGYACALGLVMFVFIFAGTAVMNRIKVNQDMEG